MPVGFRHFTSEASYQKSGGQREYDWIFDRPLAGRSGFFLLQKGHILFWLIVSLRAWQHGKIWHQFKKFGKGMQNQIKPKIRNQSLTPDLTGKENQNQYLVLSLTRGQDVLRVKIIIMVTYYSSMPARYATSSMATLKVIQKLIVPETFRTQKTCRGCWYKSGH